MEKEYDIAAEKSRKNNPEGYLKLYKIASESNSAELSEIARDELLHLLYSEINLWINIFSKVDLEEFKSYLKYGGLAILELPEGV